MVERKVSDSLVETIHMVRPQHLNSVGRLFGGTIMQWIDEVAGLVAKRHTHMSVTTASVDNLNFLRSAFQRDVIVLIGRMTYVGNTSMEIRVDTYVENLEGIRKPINRAYVTMVALGHDGKPTVVPKLVLETVAEQMEWEGGKRRREMRDLRRQEGF